MQKTPYTDPQNQQIFLRNKKKMSYLPIFYLDMRWFLLPFPYNTYCPRINTLPRTSHIPAPNTHRPLLNSCFPAFQWHSVLLNPSIQTHPLILFLPFHAIPLCAFQAWLEYSPHTLLLQPKCWTDHWWFPPPL